jgi:ribose 5-phosphate isomerase B
VESAAVSDSSKDVIPIATDHAGFELKEKLKAVLESMGSQVLDLGAYTPEPTDYPDFAHPLARMVSSGEVNRGILLCGSGVGVDIVANRYSHVRAALAWMPEIAELSRRHNDSNVLVIPARFVSEEMAVEIVKRWLSTDFEGGRHARRVTKIDDEPNEASSTEIEAGA